MGKDATQIIKEISELSKITDSKVWTAAAEALCGEAYKIKGDKDLLDSGIPVGTRLSMAQKICAEHIRGQEGMRIQLPQGKKDILKIETVDDLQKIIGNKDLTPAELEEILDATFYIHDANDKLNKTLIEKDLKASMGKDTIEEKELLAARKQRTEEFLMSERERLSKQRLSKEKSNSKGDLLDLEKKVSAIARAKTLEPDAKKAAFARVATSNSLVGSAIAVGDGLALYKNGAGFMASTVAKTLIENGAMKVAEKIGLSAAIKGLGVATGPIGALLTSAISMLGGSQLIERGLKYALLGAGGLVAAGLLAVPAVVVAAGVLLIGVVGVIATSAGITIAGAVAGGVVFVAFVTFIINSGGYIVPPGSQLPGSTGGVIGTIPGTAVNPYIEVTKTANPPGPFPNPVAFPKSIEYTITVRAKQMALTNIVFKYACQAFSGTNIAGSVPCPPTPTVPAAPIQIDSSTPFTFTYQMVYNGAFFNSIVMDSFTVNASAGGTATGQAVGSAAVIFGNPPIGCFTFAPGWPDNEKLLMVTAIVQMRIEASYFTKLCAGGPITLARGAGNPGWAGQTAGRLITFYDSAISNDIRSAFYTLAHESGHVFANAYLSIFSDFGVLPFIPLPIDYSGYVCSYPIQTNPSPDIHKQENFAESIAVIYRGENPVTSGFPFTCMGGPFSGKYPGYYNFIRGRVFN